MIVSCQVIASIKGHIVRKGPESLKCGEVVQYRSNDNPDTLYSSKTALEEGTQLELSDIGKSK